MLKQDDHGVPFTEKRDTAELYQIPYYEDTAGMAPCGAIISNIQDMSHWLMALPFRIQQYSDVVFEFVVENGQVKGLKQRSSSGEYVFTRK